MWSPIPVQDRACAAQNETAASGAAISGDVRVTYDAAAGQLGVAAEGADLRRVLASIAEKSGVTIEVGEGIAKQVSVFFAALPLEQGINAVVAAAGEANLAAEYSGKPGAGGGSFRLEKVTLLRKGQDRRPAAVPVQVTSATPRATSLDILVREAGNPGTSRERKRDLRQEIERSARTPEEKAELKRRVLDGRAYGELADDLQLALLRSMREHPETSDRAYVLELLRRKAPVGPLLRDRVGSREPAYVDYLLSAAQGRDLYAIELLGEQRIPQAAAVLESLATESNKDVASREAAAKSLRRIGVSKNGASPGR